METQKGKPSKKKIFDDVSTSRGNSRYILKDLHVKTLARFICVSKPWGSIIRNRDFVKSYLIKSSTRPQSLIFTFKSRRHGKHFFFSHYPSTRRSIALPNVDAHRIRMYHYLGYDPINGDYKMLCMSRGMHVRKGHGSSWRMIENSPPHSPESPHICIDGVLYYGAYLDLGSRKLTKDHAVMSFDVRSEKFDLIKLPPGRATRFKMMIRYNGKLAIMLSGGFLSYPGRIELWVLEDAAKHECPIRIHFYFENTFETNDLYMTWFINYNPCLLLVDRDDFFLAIISHILLNSHTLLQQPIQNNLGSSVEHFDDLISAEVEQVLPVEQVVRLEQVVVALL
ncbi:hypothetical protein N665_0226s0036 [Sinapis alba]|nr:hypothetical protein N665_0226s0036 [Sinapis alba]